VTVSEVISVSKNRSSCAVKLKLSGVVSATPSSDDEPPPPQAPSEAANKIASEVRKTLLCFSVVAL
jgi:hypothetical protein